MAYYQTGKCSGKKVTKVGSARNVKDMEKRSKQLERSQSMPLWKLREDEQNRIDNFIDNASELDDPLSKETIVLIEILANAHEEALLKIDELTDEVECLNGYIDDWI